MRDLSKLSFFEIVDEILEYKNCYFESDYFIIKDLHFTVNRAIETVNSIIESGKDPRKNLECKVKKRNMRLILEHLINLDYEKN